METLSRHAKIQTSETFLLSAILALSGGFQDAYTYNVRNGVFSNAPVSYTHLTLPTNREV